LKSYDIDNFVLLGTATVMHSKTPYSPGRVAPDVLDRQKRQRRAVNRRQIVREVVNRFEPVLERGAQQLVEPRYDGNEVARYQEEQSGTRP
jgi:hypothetical protein